jgi:hypothetical protein
LTACFQTFLLEKTTIFTNCSQELCTERQWGKLYNGEVYAIPVYLHGKVEIPGPENIIVSLWMNQHLALKQNLD